MSGVDVDGLEGGEEQLAGAGVVAVRAEHHECWQPQPLVQLVIAGGCVVPAMKVNTD